MDHEFGAFLVTPRKVKSPAMAPHQLGCDGKAQAGAALSGPALKCRKQVLACLWRQTRASVANADPPFDLVLAG